MTLSFVQAQAMAFGLLGYCYVALALARRLFLNDVVRVWVRSPSDTPS